MQFFDDMEVSFVRKSREFVIYYVAKNVVKARGTCTWEFYHPSWILSSLQIDDSLFLMYSLLLIYEIYSSRWPKEEKNYFPTSLQKKKNFHKIVFKCYFF